MSSPPPADSVHVASKTWARDSHDLFDFEAVQVHREILTVQRSAQLYRAGATAGGHIEVGELCKHEDAPRCGDPLLCVVERDGAFWVDKAAGSSSSPTRRLWMVVRDLAPRGLRLSEGDTIKLGRFKFRVRQLVASGSARPELQVDGSNSVCSPDPRDLQSAVCRICLTEGPGTDDPLITPCRCKGSIEHVHLGCLRHWIRGQLNLNDSTHGSYFYQPPTCELCKAAYSTYVHDGASGERVPLAEVPRTEPPFIVLENMNRDARRLPAVALRRGWAVQGAPEGALAGGPVHVLHLGDAADARHPSRGVHVMHLGEKAVRLGRGHECDIRFADVSISRCHATIRFDGGDFILEDNCSKFGTLLAMRKPRQLERSKPLSVQAGRTVLTLSLHPREEPLPAQAAEAAALPDGEAPGDVERASPPRPSLRRSNTAPPGDSLLEMRCL